MNSHRHQFVGHPNRGGWSMLTATPRVGCCLFAGRALGSLAVASVLLVAAGCTRYTDRDLSATSPYSEMIGAEYEVRVDDLELYGISDVDRRTEVTSMTLVPPPGIGGSEVAFRCRVPRGTRLRIAAVRHRNLVFDNGLYYLLELPGSGVPEGIPIELELFRGNEGEGREPNAHRYRRIGRGDAAAGSQPSFTCPRDGIASPTFRPIP